MSKWKDRGSGVVNAGADFAQGVGEAFKGLGNRFKRGRHEKFIETFCCIGGVVAAQNGRLFPEEIKAIRSFFLDNRSNSAFSSYSSDELIEKIRAYAVAYFLCDEEVLVRAVGGVEVGSDSAKMCILGALAIAFGDGECDRDEALTISRYASELGVGLTALANEFGIHIPDLPRVSKHHMLPPSPPFKSVDSSVKTFVSPNFARNENKPCLVCKGKRPYVVSCVFCNGSGIDKF